MANLLDSASILLTPTAYNNGSILAIQPSDGSGDMTFSRGSSATRVNAQGLIEDVQILSSNLVSNGDFSQESSELVTNGDFATDTDWIKNGQVTIGGGVAYFDSDGTFTQIAQSIIGVSGKNVKVVIEITEYTQGTLKVLFSGGTQQNLPNSIGVHTLYFNNADSDTINIARLGGVTNLKIDNISVKEVGQDWTLGTGWSIGSNELIATSMSNQFVTQSFTFTSGKRYKASFSVIGTSSLPNNASLRLPYDGDLPNIAYVAQNSDGVYSHEFVSNGSSTLYLGYGSFTGSITNISVTEITDDTDLPRIDYTDGCGSLLLEPQSTNLITQSELFSDSSWIKSSTTVSANSTISADGTQNASLIQSTQTGSALVSVSYPTLTVGNTYTFSCFAKKGNNDWIRLAHISSGGTGCWFDLENGVVGTVNSQSATIEDYGNGWYKCTNTFIATTSTGANLVFIGICDADGSTNAGIVGQNDYLWGAQVEENSYASSYIPTQGVISTRLADIATNSSNASLINSEEGVLYAEISALDDSGGFRAISLSDGVSNRLYIAYNANSNQITVLLNSLIIIHYVIADVTEYIKVAFKYKVNDFALWINGIEVNTASSGNTLPYGTLTQMQFNSGFGGSPFYGKNKALAVYKTALTDEQLTALTTI